MVDIKHFAEIAQKEKELIPDKYHELIDVIGVENFINMSQFYGGTELYIPQYDSLIKPIRNRAIINEFDGGNYIQLARKYGVSQSQIRNIINGWWYGGKTVMDINRDTINEALEQVYTEAAKDEKYSILTVDYNHSLDEIKSMLPLDQQEQTYELDEIIIQMRMETECLAYKKGYSDAINSTNKKWTVKKPLILCNN